MFEERRRKARMNGFTIGSLNFAGSSEWTGCLIWDHTNLGALLEIEPNILLPDVFLLVVPDLSIQCMCKLIWSEDCDHGVDFIL